MDRPQSRSGCGGEEKILYPYRQFNSGRHAHSLVTVLSELPRENMDNGGRGECPLLDNYLYTMFVWRV
jgi:hypothetical protein